MKRVEALPVGVGAAIEGADVGPDGPDLAAEAADIAADLLHGVEDPAEVDDVLAVPLVPLLAEVGAVVVLDLPAGGASMAGRLGGGRRGALAVAVGTAHERHEDTTDRGDDRHEHNVAHGVTGAVHAARQVSGPISPSGSSPFSRWNASTLSRSSAP